MPLSFLALARKFTFGLLTVFFAVYANASTPEECIKFLTQDQAEFSAIAGLVIEQAKIYSSPDKDKQILVKTYDKLIRERIKKLKETRGFSDSLIEGEITKTVEAEYEKQRSKPSSRLRVFNFAKTQNLLTPEQLKGLPDDIGGLEYGKLLVKAFQFNPSPITHDEFREERKLVISELKYALERAYLDIPLERRNKRPEGPGPKSPFSHIQVLDHALTQAYDSLLIEYLELFPDTSGTPGSHDSLKFIQTTQGLVQIISSLSASEVNVLFRKSIQRDSIIAANCFFQMGADPNQIIRHGQNFDYDYDQTFLDLAVRAKNWNLVKTLLTNKIFRLLGTEQIDKIFDKKGLPLTRLGAATITAIESGVLPEFIAVIKSTHPNKTLWQPLLNSMLLAAAKIKNTQALNILLEHGAEVNASDEQGLTPLHWAVTDLYSVRILLKFNVNVNLVDNSNSTPLFALGMRPEYDGDIHREDVFDLLKDAGVNLNAINKNGDTALDASFYRMNSEQELKLKFLNAGVPFGKKDPNTVVARLDSASAKSNRSLFIKIFENAVDDSNKDSVIVQTLNDLISQVVTPVITLGSANPQISSELIQYVITKAKELHANLNLEDPRTTFNYPSLLVRALFQIRNYPLAQNLIDAGANIDYKKSAHDETLLFYAVRTNNSKVIEFLLENKANAKLYSMLISGVPQPILMTPLDLAKDSSKNNLLNIFKEFGIQ